MAIEMTDEMSKLCILLCDDLDQIIDTHKNLSDVDHATFCKTALSAVTFFCANLLDRIIDIKHFDQKISLANDMHKVINEILNNIENKRQKETKNDQ